MESKQAKKVGLRYQTFPKSVECCLGVKNVIESFEAVHKEINSYDHNTNENKLESNDVLSKVCDHLKQHGFLVETGKKTSEKITIPVLFGVNNSKEKCFEVDAFHEENRIVVEVEAGQALSNYRFLKDLFEACQMPQVDHLVIAVRNIYRQSADFDRICTFFETLYVNGRLLLPLKSVTILGY